jgi:hypothetical protein
MAGVTTDIKSWPVGTEQSLTSYGVGSNQQLYEGAVALISGSGSVTTGYVKNAAVAGAADLVAGIVDRPAGGTQVEVGAGVLGGSTDGAVWINVRCGSFMIQSGTGADLLSATTNGKTVYYGGENANGPIACATSGGATRPALGIQLAQDPGIAGGGYAPGPNYWPIKLNTIGGTLT